MGRRPRCFLRTPFEETNGATYTNDVNEYFYTGALDAASERMRVVEIGRTLLGRPINMFIFGYPGPLPSAEQISESPTTLIQCHVHGNEPSMRESCLILARELAFTDDRHSFGSSSGRPCSSSRRSTGRPRRQHPRQLYGSRTTATTRC